MVERKRIWRTVVITKCRQITRVLGPAESQLAEEGQGLGHELTRSVPLMRVSRCQSQEVAGRGIVQSFWLFELPLVSTCNQGNLTASFNHDDSSRKQMGAVLCLEMFSRTSWEGCDKGTDHTRQQTKKLGLCTVFTVGE